MHSHDAFQSRWLSTKMVTKRGILLLKPNEVNLGKKAGNLLNEPILTLRWGRARSACYELYV